MSEQSQDASIHQIIRAILEASGKRALRSAQGSVPEATFSHELGRVDPSQVRTALAVLLQIPLEALTDANFEEVVSRIETQASEDADRYAHHLASLATRFQVIGCITADQILEYLDVADSVLVELHHEASQPSPSPTKVKRLVLQYALDARKPIKGNIYRFDIRRREAGFEVIEYPSLPVTAIPCPGVFIRDLLTIALLECVEQQVPNFYRLLELLERSLDSEPPAKPQNVVSCGTGVTGIEVDLQRSTITVRGVTYRVDLAGAHFADVVVRANGSLVTGETIAAVAPLVGTRPDRVRSALPEAVQQLIESRRGCGYRLCLQQLEQLE